MRLDFKLELLSIFVHFVSNSPNRSFQIYDRFEIHTAGFHVQANPLGASYFRDVSLSNRLTLEPDRFHYSCNYLLTLKTTW